MSLILINQSVIGRDKLHSHAKSSVILIFLFLMVHFSWLIEIYSCFLHINYQIVCICSLHVHFQWNQVDRKKHNWVVSVDFLDELFSMILLGLDFKDNVRSISNIISSLPFTGDIKKTLFGLAFGMLTGTIQLPRSIIPATGSRRILQERCWKVTGSCRRTREISGTWKQYSRPEFSGFFPMISWRILSESTEICRNPPEKIREIPDRNTASNFLVFSVANRPFLAVRHSPG